MLHVAFHLVKVHIPFGTTKLFYENITKKHASRTTGIHEASINLPQNADFSRKILAIRILALSAEIIQLAYSVFLRIQAFSRSCWQ